MDLQILKSRSLKGRRYICMYELRPHDRKNFAGQEQWRILEIFQGDCHDTFIEIMSQLFDGCEHLAAGKV